MAIMIPSVLDPEIKSEAEKHIFSWFKTAPDTDNWVVLHSLGICNHHQVVHGEVDFFVLVPQIGIFALEVKGGRVKRENGIWYYTNRYNKTDCKTYGPFDQAWEGLYSIRNSLRERLDGKHKHLRNIFMGIGVMFPDIAYESVGIDEEQWQVFDCNDGNRVRDYILRVAAGSIKAWENQYGSVTPDNRPSDDDIRYIASLLRGDFDKALSLRIQYNYAEEELVTLTENQYRCIDQLEDNPRCLIIGAAGTGKTLLAVEEVKKSVAKDEKVALFCFNRILSLWLKEYFNKMPNHLRPEYIGTIHGYMMKILLDANEEIAFPDENDDRSEFYEETLPYRATAISDSKPARFDRIIVDETQDIMSDGFLKFINSCVKGGLSRGRWTLFGDFHNQAIYEKNYSPEQFIGLLETYTSFIRYKLNTNCRNTKNVCNEIVTVTGISDDVKYSGKTEGPSVNHIIFRNEAEEKDKLINIIVELKKNAVEDGRITILSPRKREHSVVRLLEGIQISDYVIPAVEKITFSTIQAFKGLENTVIILTDINSFADRKLMYVALSRARSGLYILESMEARNEYIELSRKRLTDLFARRKK